jgi:DsbC/DsbD-like thiol-disulfide interchange protein
MKMKNGWLLSVAIIALSACLSGCSNANRNQGSNVGSPAPPKVRSSKDVVKFGGSGVVLSAPGQGSVDIVIVIDPGYHVNGNPATFSYLIPTEVTAEKVEGVEAGKPIYPTAEKKKFQFAEEPLAVYEGEIKIKLPLRLTQASGSRQLPVNVRVQACDQEECFPPDTLHTTIALDVK